MAKYLVANGIEENRIIIEDKATNTFENLKFSLDRLREFNDKENLKVLIVTNKHLYLGQILSQETGHGS